MNVILIDNAVRTSNLTPNTYLCVEIFVYNCDVTQRVLLTLILLTRRIR